MNRSAHSMARSWSVRTWNADRAQPISPIATAEARTPAAIDHTQLGRAAVGSSMANLPTRYANSPYARPTVTDVQERRFAPAPGRLPPALPVLLRRQEHVGGDVPGGDRGRARRDRRHRPLRPAPARRVPGLLPAGRLLRRVGPLPGAVRRPAPDQGRRRSRRRAPLPDPGRRAR